MAARGEQRESAFDLRLELSPGAPEQRAEPTVEPELLTMESDEVEHGAHGLPGMASQSSAELLEEQRGAVGRPQQEQRVHRGHVDAFVEEVDREHRAHPSIGEVSQPAAAFVGRCLGPDRDRLDPCLGEYASHEPGVRDADAEAEGAHPTQVIDPARELLQHAARPRIVAGQQLREAVDVVATTPTPRDLAQVEAVVDAVVQEGREALAIDRVPEPQLGRDPSIEPVQHREAVAPLGRRGESEELARREVGEERPIGLGRGVVELIDHDHVEVGGFEVRVARRGQALDGGEDMLEPGRPCAADPELAERRIPERMTERGQALREELFAVRDEQEPRARQGLLQSGIVEGRHDRLARAGRGHEQVSMMSLLPGDGDEVEEPLLEGFGPELDGTDRHLGGCALGRPGSRGERVAIEGDEVAAVPVGLEDGLDGPQHAWVSSLGGADVPLEPGELRRVGEVRRADVRRGQARGAGEQPGLGVEARAALVVRDLYLRAEGLELLEGGELRRARVGGGQHAQRATCVDVSAEIVEERRDAAATDEGHDDVDAVRGRDLAAELHAHARLARRVREERGVEERGLGCGQVLEAAVGEARDERRERRPGLARPLAGHPVGARRVRDRRHQASREADAERDTLRVADALEGLL